MAAGKQERRSVIYPSGEIPFLLVRSQRKTWAISIEEDGNVCIRVPFAMTEREISRILSEKKNWIETHYQERQRLLREREQERERQGLPAVFNEKQREALKKRYIQAARDYFPKRAAYYQTLTGGQYTRITIREQKTRWGSCSSRGTLSFNWRLMLAPPAILDYVVVHELCHLSHMNHSRAFWESVERVLPDYRERRQWLKEHGSELML